MKKRPENEPLEIDYSVLDRGQTNESLQPRSHRHRHAIWWGVTGAFWLGILVILWARIV